MERGDVEEAFWNRVIIVDTGLLVFCGFSKYEDDTQSSRVIRIYRLHGGTSSQMGHRYDEYQS